MKRASYREAIWWIAANDDTEWVDADLGHGPEPESVTASLVADLFGVDADRVRIDVRRKIKQIEKMHDREVKK